MPNFTLNGQELQHANTDVQLVGPVSTLQLLTHTKINYRDGAKKEPTKDAKGQIDGFTIKDQETEGSMTVRKSEWTRIKQWAFQQYTDGRGVGQMQFILSCTFGTTANPAMLKTEKVPIMFQEDPTNSESNQDALMAELSLFVSGSIEREGEQPFIVY